MTHTTEELEKLMAEATPGPWKVIEDISAAQVKGYPIIESAEYEIVGLEGFYGRLETDWANARLIILMRNALPELLAKVKRQEQALKLGKIVMDMLEEHGPSIVPHLLDTDENAGQRFRDALNQETGE